MLWEKMELAIGIRQWGLDSERVSWVDVLSGPKYKVSHDGCTTQLLAYIFIAETVCYIPWLQSISSDKNPCKVALFEELADQEILVVRDNVSGKHFIP